MAGKSAIPLLFAAGVGAALLSKKKKGKSSTSQSAPEDYLNGYFSPGATVGAANGLSNIEKSVKLSGITMRDDDGEMHSVASATFQPDGTWMPGSGVIINWPISGKGLDRVVTNFYGPGAVAFGNEVMNEFISGDRPADAKDPAVAKAVAMDVLKRLRPKIKWSSVKAQSAEGMVLEGARTIARIVQQNLPGA